MPQTYGTVEGEGEASAGAASSVQLKTKPTMAHKIIPFVFMLVVVGSCVVVSNLYTAEQSLKQDLYAFEQDDFNNKNIIWNGRRWVDESNGHAVTMAQQQPQSLLQTEMLAATASPSYDCCYVPKPGNHNNGVLVDGSKQKVESGMFCHMALKNVPSNKWPMIRMGNLREAGVSNDPGEGAGMLAKHQLHHCRGDLIFKTQNVAVLDSRFAQSLDQVP